MTKRHYYNDQTLMTYCGVGTTRGASTRIIGSTTCLRCLNLMQTLVGEAIEVQRAD
jgi:hypothetical protein